MLKLNLNRINCFSCHMAFWTRINLYQVDKEPRRLSKQTVSWKEDSGGWLYSLPIGWILQKGSFVEGHSATLRISRKFISWGLPGGSQSLVVCLWALYLIFVPLVCVPCSSCWKVLPHHGLRVCIQGLRTSQSTRQSKSTIPFSFLGIVSKRQETNTVSKHPCHVSSAYYDCLLSVYLSNGVIAWIAKVMQCRQ